MNKFKRNNVAIRLAFKNLKINPARTLLSLLGIVIGVAAVITVLSLGLGFKSFVNQQVEAFGTDIIEIEYKTPNTDQMSSQNASGAMGGQATTLKLKDVEKVSELSNIDAWYAGSMGQEILSYENENKRTILMGVTEGIEIADSDFKIKEGKMFSDEDGEGLKQVVILGSKIKKNLFGSKNALGESIKIDNKRYKVIGVLEERGGAGVLDFDEMVYLPVRTLHKKILGIDYVAFAIYKLKDFSKVDLTILEAEDVMRELHDIDNFEDDDFAIVSIAEASEMIDSIFNTINILLVGLTSVSLIVGGVGIMNVMYVSVMERTFEIGLRKSLGAKKNDILKQFLFEALFLTVLGGFLGVFCGVIIAIFAEFLIAKFGYSLSLPLSWGGVFLGVGFSAFVGIVFGIYPAKKAANLSPMEALRR